MMADTRATGGASVTKDDGLAVRVGFALANFPYFDRCTMLLLAALWVFNRKAY
jgi:hypothetical protein